MALHGRTVRSVLFRLPSVGIAHHLRYYPAIRLPVSPLPSSMSTASAHQFYYISGLKCLMILLPRCLHLAHSVITAFPRLATDGLVKPFLVRFSTRYALQPWLGARSFIVLMKKHEEK